MLTLRYKQPTEIFPSRKRGKKRGGGRERKSKKEEKEMKEKMTFTGEQCMYNI